MDGILIIDKSEDWTSHDVVGRARKILKTKRIGHTGTLDPFATGVLVLLVGKATRLAQFLDKDAKEYEAVIRFGFETETGDRTGELRITNYELRNISVEEIENILKSFRGEIWQTPPMHSAKKIDGKKLCELARKGIEIEREPVKVTIYELRITNYELREKISDSGFKTQDLEIRVLCSAGTYIRTLAEDIGKKLNFGAHLAELRRTKAGKFFIENSVTLERLEEIVSADKLEEHLISMNETLAHLAEIKLSTEDAGKIKNGIKLKRDLKDASDGEFVRLTSGENLLAVGRYNETEKIVQPKLVLM
ncbi:MAG: tRNA pseudouridine(55) synthase TruB [Pyrinomonadaceae bacterium]